MISCDKLQPTPDDSAMRRAYQKLLPPLSMKSKVSQRTTYEK
jgi:hypothetical protein